MNKVKFALAAVTLATISVGGAAALAGHPTPEGYTRQLDAASSRTAAYVAATQRELEGSSTSITAGELAQTIDGHEIYFLRGDAHVCLLVAGADQPNGKSQDLSCGLVSGPYGSPDEYLSADINVPGDRHVTAVVVPDSVTGVRASARDARSTVRTSLQHNVAVFDGPATTEYSVSWDQGARSTSTAAPGAAQRARNASVLESLAARSAEAAGATPAP